MNNWFKNILVYVLAVIIFLTSGVLTYAHEALLDVEYDDCEVDLEKGTPVNDGEDEIWYYLNSRRLANYVQHIDHETQTIRYYFADRAKDDRNYTWTTDIYTEYLKTMSPELALEEAEKTAENIKKAYADSMKKWNNVYYYSYDEDGNRIANKVINIIEGTEENHNLTIYPINYYQSNSSDESIFDVTYAACVIGRVFSHVVEELEINPIHFHCANWYMNVNVTYFFIHDEIIIDGKTIEPLMNIIHLNHCLDRVGMHEIGHILGLKDVEVECINDSWPNHHKELLMGYGEYAATDASYKDIAGVSITRGFHTDEDHVWMLRTNDDGTQDVICAQCNGVRKGITLTNGTYEGKQVNIYKSCVHHGGTNEEMLLVATDGKRNFFKCQYCRYIETLDLSNYIAAPTCSKITITKEMSSESIYKRIVVKRSGVYQFNSNSINNFSFSLCDDNLNYMGYSFNGNVSGSYFNVYLDEGTYYLKVKKNISGTSTYTVSIKPTINTHSYTDWKTYSSTHHIECCEYCGITGTKTSLHVVKSSDISLGIGYCMHCGAKVMLGDSFVQHPGMLSISKVSINGSYVLPNGIIVLVDEDIEAYENGTLVWYDKDKLPVTQ